MVAECGGQPSHVGAKLVDEEAAQLQVPVNARGGLQPELEAACLEVQTAHGGLRELGDPRPS